MLTVAGPCCCTVQIDASPVVLDFARRDCHAHPCLLSVAVLCYLLSCMLQLQYSVWILLLMPLVHVHRDVSFACQAPCLVAAGCSKSQRFAIGCRSAASMGSVLMVRSPAVCLAGHNPACHLCFLCHAIGVCHGMAWSCCHVAAFILLFFSCCRLWGTRQVVSICGACVVPPRPPCLWVCAGTQDTVPDYCLCSSNRCGTMALVCLVMGDGLCRCMFQQGPRRSLFQRKALVLFCTSGRSVFWS